MLSRQHKGGRVMPAYRSQMLAAIALLTTCQAFAQPSPTPLHQGFANVPGAKIAYQDSGGGGVPVVFLHAFTGSAAVWEHQIPAFTRAGYRFIAYDRRGFGRTVADPNGPASTGADDLVALLDQLKVGKFHLVATAGGGFVAIDFAISFPERLRSFTLLCSTGGIQDKDYVEATRAMRPEGFEKMPNSFLELSPSYRFANQEGVARWTEFEKNNRAPEAVRGPAQPSKNRVTLAMLEQIKVPTLVIAGDADLYAPPALMRRIAERIAGAGFTVIPEAGHSVWWESPETFNRTVLAFISKH